MNKNIFSDSVCDLENYEIWLSLKYFALLQHMLKTYEENEAWVSHLW